MLTYILLLLTFPFLLKIFSLIIIKIIILFFIFLYFLVNSLCYILNFIFDRRWKVSRWVCYFFSFSLSIYNDCFIRFCNNSKSRL